MNEQNNDTNAPKKINLQEAIRNKLASKKSETKHTQNKKNRLDKNQTVKSQQTKKINNQKKRTGI